ncbi:hypothetical protein A1F94_011846 [Pyrenophora tritici-repentis]|nr:hypothetical protein A1F94_011846 [Pyrenophora tritici-repentis]
MGKQWYNHRSRSQQQRAGATNFVNSTKTQAQVRDREGPLEGINVWGQAQNANRGRLDYRNRENVRDERSRSPERSNSQDESRGHYRNNSRPHTPLPSTKLGTDSKANHQQVREVEASAPASQSVKRKRDNDDANEEPPRSHKKPNTGSGEMTPTACQKVVTGLAALKKLSDEERKKLRAAKFAPKPTVPTKAPVEPKEIPQNTNRRVANVVTQDERKASPISAINAAVTNSPTQHNHVTTASQNEHTKTPDTKTHNHPPTSTKIDSPKQDTIKSTSVTPENKTSVPKISTPPTSLHVSPNTTNPPSKKRKRDDVEETESSASEAKPKSQSSSTAAHPSVIQANIEKRNAKLKELMGSAQAEEKEYPHKAIEYVEYSIYSIPISYSTLIEHEYEFEPIDTPPKELKWKMTASEYELFWS